MKRKNSSRRAPGASRFQCGPHGPKLSPYPPETCRKCGLDRVHPLEWDEVEGLVWEMTLRCPDCQYRRHGYFDKHVVKRYDEHLIEAAGLLIEESDRVTRENMAEALDCLHAALESDALLPSDF